MGRCAAGMLVLLWFNAAGIALPNKIFTMTQVTIYHNPRCSKSRRTLALLRERGVEPEIVHYLETPPDAAALEVLLNMLGLAPRALMRRREAPYKALNLADEGLTRAELVNAMVANPILIERPIVTAQGKAAIGRPPENVLGIL